jgi:hypothetical protein
MVNCLLSLFTFLAGAPIAAPAPLTITVRNPLAVARPAETVSLPLARAAALVQRVGAQNLVVKDAQTGAVLVSQLLDANADGTPDELLFQTAMPARGTRKFVLDGAAAGAPRPASAHTTFARFVPERTDDFAWENERVAFRTYGPVAEQLFDKKDPAGTLTSGMDCWLKRVDYPIINKWYAQHVLTPFSYHKDVGEGYDPYHVGLSRGVGGIGVWDRDSLYVSRNFTSYKVLATGPIRAVFELTYAPWDANGRRVTERKVISLDLGSNLTRYEDHLASAQLHHRPHPARPKRQHPGRRKSRVLPLLGGRGRLFPGHRRGAGAPAAAEVRRPPHPAQRPEPALHRRQGAARGPRGFLRRLWVGKKRPVPRRGRLGRLPPGLRPAPGRAPASAILAAQL